MMCITPPSCASYLAKSHEDINIQYWWDEKPRQSQTPLGGFTPHLTGQNAQCKVLH